MHTLVDRAIVAAVLAGTLGVVVARALSAWVSFRRQQRMTRLSRRAAELLESLAREQDIRTR